MVRAGILEQDPTTLVGPAAVMKNYHTLGPALKLFWPELVATIVGVGFLAGRDQAAPSDPGHPQLTRARRPQAVSPLDAR